MRGQRLTLRTFTGDRIIGPFFAPPFHARARCTNVPPLVTIQRNTGTQAISRTCQTVLRTSISIVAKGCKVGEAPGPRAKNLPGDTLTLKENHPPLLNRQHNTTQHTSSLNTANTLREYQGPAKDHTYTHTPTSLTHVIQTQGNTPLFQQPSALCHAPYEHAWQHFAHAVIANYFNPGRRGQSREDVPECACLGLVFDQEQSIQKEA